MQEQFFALRKSRPNDIDRVGGRIMTTPRDESGPLQNWQAILDAMGESVARSLEAVANFNPESETSEAEATAGSDAEVRQRLDDTIRGLEQRLDAAQSLAARIEDMLDRDEREVRAWQAAAESSRERLAASAPLS
jgi:hypothetical protein